MAERVVYLNGQIVAESKASISIRDLGFLHGDAAFDTARTFNGKVFKLREHVDRLYQSLRFLRIDPGMPAAQMAELTEEVARRNAPLLGPNEDYWVSQRVTRGRVDDPSHKATVLIECRPLPLKQRAKYFRDGVQLVTSSLRRTPPWVMSPQVKTHNYLNVVMADLEAKAQNPDAWVALLDERGNLAEGSSYNIFLVKDGVLYTPRAQMVLNGITRQTVLELASQLKILSVEKDVDLYDASAADEMFITSTSLCVCPARNFNGVTVGNGHTPGPVTKGLMAAFSERVGMDYVGQYLANLGR
jgi:branched-chain amino acid aminotransferase